MSASLEWNGLTDLAREIAALPPMVRAEFKPTVVGGAERIVSRVTAEYAARGVPNVGKGMRVESSPEADDISARVINPSPLGHLYEFGTVERHVAVAKPIPVLIKGQWVTVTGTSRGRMPERPVFVPIVEQERGIVVTDLERDLREVGARLRVLALAG